MPYLGECGEQRVAEHGLIQPWVRRVRCDTSIDCGGRSVLRGRSAHSRRNGHDTRDHDPISHLSLLRSLSLALGRETAKAGARRSYLSAVVEETTPLPKRLQRLGRTLVGQRTNIAGPFELGRREPDQTQLQGSAVR